ncbi:UNVERIFIED_CONTAM: hypothetical protein H355_001379 [Colinus virginianus]|nr:hypothetical protein H355_001379 [Colinus virginianus]
MHRGSSGRAMNLGDGLKLETEVLDGKPRLILAASDKAKPAVKMGNKDRVPKQTLRIRHTGRILRSSQNACINQENLAKPRSGSSLSVSKGERAPVTKPSSREATTKDHSLIFQRDTTNRKPDSENLNAKERKHESQNTHISAEDLRSLVCLTQEQLQEILMIVKGGTRHISEAPNEKQEEMGAGEASEKNTVALLQKACEVSSLPDEPNCNSSRKQESCPQPREKVIFDCFPPTSCPEDEQVALKKKLKETLEADVVYLGAKAGSDKKHTEKMETADPNKEAVPQEQPFSASKHEQQKKWLKELDKQKEEAQLRKIEEKLNLSKAEEHDRWAMHFDSLKNHLNTNAQHPLNGIHKKQPESLCPSPDPKELTAFVHPFSPAALGNFIPSKVGNAGKGAKNSALDHSQKTSFLRSMTALLDPAEIEERDRRRQKQLEHQKAIMAQVEEKRKKKQLEEEKRKLEEQEEELRLAREKELMQKQFEEDMLKQKQKEELVILKTNELHQTVQKAQELAQRLKQEQRIQDLAQKGHDISNLKRNLGGGKYQRFAVQFGVCVQTVTVLFFSCFCNSHNVSDDIHTGQQTSARKDTAVQTDDCTTSAYIATAEERTSCCGSPDISVEYKETSNSQKYHKEMHCTDRNRISGQENGIYSELYEQYARKERQVKPSEKPGKRPDWNIKKPEKRYIPASERYPKPLQKQREENKVRRQLELLQLVERNTPGNLCQKKGCSDRSPSPREELKSKGHRIRKEEQLRQNHLNEERICQSFMSAFLLTGIVPHRSDSPPVPAVKNRIQQAQQKQTCTRKLEVYNSNRREKNTKADTQQKSFPAAATDAGRAPSSQFIPYVRTNEVYYLDPHAPVTRPSTHDPQYRHFNGTEMYCDPIHGLLQKQKELEAGLIPVKAQEESFISPF